MLSWILITPALAQAAQTGSQICNNAGKFYVGLSINGEHCFATYKDYIIALFSQAINIAFALAILMALWGAFKYMTANGDDSKARDGKDTIVGAVIGFALLVLIKVLLPLFQIQ